MVDRQWRIIFGPALACVFFLSSNLAWANKKQLIPQAGKPFIHRNVCPGEGCRFGKWTAKELIPVYKQPKSKQVVYTIQKGESFTSLYGEDHIVPVKVRVSKTPNPVDLYSSIKPPELDVGDEFVILTNSGEGWITAFFKGAWFSMNCTSIGGIADTCSPQEVWAQALGNRNQGPRSNWWVKVQNKKKKEGWILAHRYRIIGRNAFE